MAEKKPAAPEPRRRVPSLLNFYGAINWDGPAPAPDKKDEPAGDEPPAKAKPEPKAKAKPEPKEKPEEKPAPAATLPAPVTVNFFNGSKPKPDKKPAKAPEPEEEPAADEESK